MDNIKRLLEISKTPGAEVPSDLLAALETEAPYFSYGAALALRRNASLPEPERKRLMQKVALNASDPAAFYDLTRPEADTPRPPFYPDAAPETPATEDAITTFLETYGHGATPAEDALIERLILNPQAEYASVLEHEYADAEDDGPIDSQTAAIDSFLAKHKASMPAAESDETENPPQQAVETVNNPTQARRRKEKPVIDGGKPLTATLANFFISQGRFERAYEILWQLNLNNKEKSIYFADQLRYLRKLIRATGGTIPDVDAQD